MAKSKDLYFVSFFLRTGLAVVFLYAAIASLLTPENWVGYFPVWLSAVIPVQLLLIAFSLYELLLGLWLLSGKKPFPAAVMTSLTLFAITATNLALLDIVFRDVAILFSALALAVFSKQTQS